MDGLRGSKGMVGLVLDLEYLVVNGSLDAMNHKASVMNLKVELIPLGRRKMNNPTYNNSYRGCSIREMKENKPCHQYKAGATLLLLTSLIDMK